MSDIIKKLDITRLNKFNFTKEIKGVLLLLLATADMGGLIACQTRRVLESSGLARHITLISMIYFAISEFFGDEDLPDDPNDILFTAIKLWMFYVIFNKMSINYTIVVFLGMIVLLYLQNYEQHKSVTEDTRNLKFIVKSTQLFILAVSIIGFISYTLKQMNDWGDKFSPILFIFGSPNCSYESN
jgi:hypothetical protein